MKKVNILYVHIHKATSMTVLINYSCNCFFCKLLLHVLCLSNCSNFYLTVINILLLYILLYNAVLLNVHLFLNPFNEAQHIFLIVNKTTFWSTPDISHTSLGSNGLVIFHDLTVNCLQTDPSAQSLYGVTTAFQN